MFTKIGQEFQSLEGQDQNCIVYINRGSIPLFGRIRSEF